jgi:hypothetical protein
MEHYIAVSAIRFLKDKNYDMFLNIAEQVELVTIPNDYLIVQAILHNAPIGVIRAIIDDWEPTQNIKFAIAFTGRTDLFDVFEFDIDEDVCAWALFGSNGNMVEKILNMCAYEDRKTVYKTARTKVGQILAWENKDIDIKSYISDPMFVHAYNRMYVLDTLDTLDKIILC